MKATDLRGGAMTGTVEQLNLSKGGIPKVAVPEAYASGEGLAGDAHFNLRYHGGPDKALLLVSAEDLAELGHAGFAVHAGALGENLTITGLDFRLLRSGQRYIVGCALIELTTLRTPCATLDVFNTGSTRIQTRLYDAKCKAGDVTSQVWAKGGFYAAVVRPGWIRTGDKIALADQAV